MSNSILISTKNTLGLAEAHTAFDQELILFINAAIGTLTQLGVGPDEGFKVSTAAETWADFIGTDLKLNSVPGYVHLRVKMLFDPPDIGFVLTAIKEQIKELESRINMIVDHEIPVEEVDDADD